MFMRAWRKISPPDEPDNYNTRLYLPARRKSSMPKPDMSTQADPIRNLRNVKERKTMWFTQWRWHLRFSLNTWVIGFIVSPEWAYTFCLGPVGIELSRADIHI